ncbi:phosphoserine phosphatase SerB [Kiloniella sp.]|uniref:phosphoserine phosphatase SerB n=1 Tax=Kiloniella sp. TaxID=1938587 RepID=UPI003B02D3E8
MERLPSEVAAELTSELTAELTVEPDAKTANVLVLTTSGIISSTVLDLCIEGLQSIGSTIIGTMVLGKNAYEIAFSGDLSLSLIKARDVLQGQEIDANALPLIGRKKNLLIADMDATIITSECIDELANIHGVSEKITSITEQAMQGAIGFEASLHKRLKLLEGLPSTAIEEAYNNSIQLTAGASTLVQTMRQGGAITILASGGFTCFAEPVAQVVGFQHYRANQLELKNGKLTVKVMPPILGRESKAAILREFIHHCELSPKSTIAVGDGANDIAMIKAADMGVAFRAKPALKAETTLHINHSDLTALLYLQGYKEEDFVTMA